eukprot:TRINITY_DN11607_c0_g1_i2.p1 TRINITY_DN11607_c0_g1~~TRINITY_DN11607_c0_g1_i2.p1  ORF type:complete len:514 (-),score=66.84 TRINITY_DN11607_c0_g1_i2:122-1663(-)
MSASLTPRTRVPPLFAPGLTRSASAFPGSSTAREADPPYYVTDGMNSKTERIVVTSLRLSDLERSVQSAPRVLQTARSVRSFSRGFQSTLVTSRTTIQRPDFPSAPTPMTARSISSSASLVAEADLANPEALAVSDYNAETLLHSGTTFLSLSQSGFRATDHVFAVAAKRCANLQMVDLSYCATIGKPGWTLLFTHCRQLRVICARNCPQLTNEFVTTAIRDLPRLRELDVTECSHIGGEDGAAWEQCVRSELETFVAHGCDPLGDEFVEKLTAKNPRLKQLVVSNCPGLTDRALESLVTNVPQLIDLDISFAELVTDRGIRTLSQALTKLKRLRLEACIRLTDTSIQKLAETCTDLTEIDLSRTSITVNSVRSLGSHCPGIQRLSLQGCDVSGQFKANTSFPELTYLDLSYSTAWTWQAQSPKLQTLLLTHCPEMTDSMVARLPITCPRLRSLTLDSCDRITDATPLGIALKRKQWPALRELRVEKCKRITNAGVARAAPLMWTTSVYTHHV